MNPSLPRLLLATAALAAPLSLLADVIDPSDYAKSFDVKFAGYAGTSTLADFPALIRLSPARNSFDYAKCAADGADLRFADADGNLLAHEIDTWTPGGESLVWVKVPALTDDTVIKVLYGYKGAGQPPAVTGSDVWANGYVGVWHTGEASTSLTQLDATANSLTLSLASDCADNVIPGVEGIVGKAADMGHRVDGKGNYGHSDGAGMLDGFANATFEVWTKQDAYPTNQAYVIVTRNNASRSPYALSQSTGGSMSMGYYADVDGTPTYVWGGSASSPLGAWNHHAFRYDSDNGMVYYTQNGVSKYSKVESVAKGHNLFSTKDQFTLGSYTTKWTANRNFVGQIDEVRISNVARSDDWVVATHDTVANEGFAVYDVPNDWTKYAKKFSVSFPGIADGTTLTDFPVLVKISASSPSGFRYADCVKEGGADLRFADENGTLLPCEVEDWNPEGESFIWVKVPTLTAGTRITGYYGWNFAPAVDSTEVWDNGFSAVWHMGADADSATQDDSTVNPLTLTKARSDNIYQDGTLPGVAGKVGKAAEFCKRDDKKGGYHGKDTSGKLDGGTTSTGASAITIEAWTFQTAVSTGNNEYRYVLAKRTGDGTGAARRTYRFMVRPSSSKVCQYWYKKVDDTVTEYNSWPGDPAPELNVWNYQVQRLNGETKEKAYFLNGNSDYHPKTEDAGVPLNALPGGDFFLGNWDDQWTATAFPGSIDEVRISNVARSDAWLQATYDTIADNARFTRYGTASDNVRGTVVFFR